MTTRIAARSTPKPPKPLRRHNGGAVIVPLVFVAFIAVAARVLALPPSVDQLTISNDSEYAINIELTDGQRQGWLGLGVAAPGDTKTVEHVLDQGSIWVLRFSAQGEDGGQVAVTRNQLDADKWTLTVPPSVGEKLRGVGAPPTPLNA